MSRNMSQKDFGEHFGFSRETIAKIERGDQRLYWDLIVPIAIFGNVSLDALADRTDLSEGQLGTAIMDPKGEYERGQPAALIKELVEENDRTRRAQLASQLLALYADLQQEVSNLKDELLTLFRKFK